MGSNERGETVGSLIQKLAAYPWGTQIVVSCKACQKGSSGGDITIRDNTQQTFGYIELETNLAYLKKPVSVEGLVSKYERRLEELYEALSSITREDDTRLKLMDLERGVLGSLKELSSDRLKVESTNP